MEETGVPDSMEERDSPPETASDCNVRNNIVYSELIL